MIELRGAHGSNDRDIVGDFCKMRQQARKLRSRLAMTSEGVGRAQQFGGAFNKGEALAFNDIFRDRLAVVLDQRRLVIEHIKLRRRAGHEEIDNALGFRREVRRFRGDGIHGGLTKQAVVQQRTKGQRTDAESRLLKKMASRLEMKFFWLHSALLLCQGLIQVQ